MISPSLLDVCCRSSSRRAAIGCCCSSADCIARRSTARFVFSSLSVLIASCSRNIISSRSLLVINWPFSSSSSLILEVPKSASISSRLPDAFSSRSLSSLRSHSKLEILLSIDSTSLVARDNCPCRVDSSTLAF